LNATDGSNQVDVHIGARIRMRRDALGLSQDSVARVLGVAVAQVQAFERGESRVSADDLYELACLLDVNIGYFFDTAAGGETVYKGGLHEAAVRFRLADHDDMASVLPR
jgi:transcriptional regulator with XRE-family HTH domain